ncbi:uncharacterized protein MELLADRAFT_96340 [Melampsora larici-populina 98AG31]|uniref:Uncharacterized protein n=1 Tax=Melampsora larici-populina (strain 98AG31 / pathotype 3-4-7) TaxID=747676 RepID=F4REF2_MELLP|nr:uncharacterized protein MELLADRAFT_96340 [Melampsora larici-populina 98AG31]EGG09280.1 hypothetical protein MELLADRAFT_96340 [Melampsora larici-populina 98AG31]
MNLNTQSDSVKSTHKQVSSPGIFPDTRNVKFQGNCNEGPTLGQESGIEKKLVTASVALGVYSKLIAALEEARVSGCLTAPMEAELRSLTLRCIKTGLAILQHKLLPAEDHVIITPDDKDKDLSATYGHSFLVFDSDNQDPTADDRQSPSPSPPELESMLPLRPELKHLPDDQISVQMNQSMSSLRPELEHLPDDHQISVQMNQSMSSLRPELERLPDDQISVQMNQSMLPLRPELKSMSSLRPELERLPDDQISVQMNQSMSSLRPELERLPDDQCSIHSTSTTHSVSVLSNLPQEQIEDPITEECNQQSNKKRFTAVLIPHVRYSNITSEVCQASNSNNSNGEPLKSVHFFLGSKEMEMELHTMLSPYSGTQTSHIAKLAAWDALRSLLQRQKLGEPLDQVFLDSIEGGPTKVVIKTKYNIQHWINTVKAMMPNLFNSHEGEPSYAGGFFNTVHLRDVAMGNKPPTSLPPLWHQTWLSMRLSVWPSSTRVTCFLKILLDSVVLTGKKFLQEPPQSEEEKAQTGVAAVCQALEWLDSQKDTNNNMHLLNSKESVSSVEFGLIHEWRHVFIKEKAAAIKFKEKSKKKSKGGSVRAPTLSYLTMFACCGIRGLICCSDNVNLTPAGQMLSFMVLSEWLSQQRPNFEVKEPVFKQSNQMIMRLIDGLFDAEGHFIKPQIMWYDIPQNLCYDYLSYWFVEAEAFHEEGDLVFPESKVFIEKSQTVTLSEDY